MIDSSKIVSVYSGRPGCMCGCRGKSSYAAQFVEQGSKERGYPVEPDEISDRNVRRIVNLLNKDPNTKIEDGIAYLETDTRYYAAYLQDRG